MNKITNYVILFLVFISLIVSIPTNEASSVLRSYILNAKINIAYEQLQLEFVQSNIEILVKEPCAPRSLEELQGKKLIAFTFDDGPNNKTTLALLEGMQEYNARATFFVLGSRVERHSGSLIKAYEQCNQIGNHTYNHYNLLKKNINIVTNEINNTNTAIYNIIGEYPTLIRPPYGNTNEKIKSIGNLPTILWNLDTLDWKYRNADRIANTIVENAEDGSIVLLHDLYSTSIEGALMAMEELKDEYAFVTIEEMAILKGIELDSTKSYTKF